MEKLNIKNNFQFKGFVPSKKVREKSENFYDLIERRSPSDSKKTAVLKKTGDHYTASLKISSAGACSFDIFSKDNSASDSISSLQKKFFNKIIKWNQTRQAKSISLNR